MRQQTLESSTVRKRRVVHVPGYDLRRPEAPYQELVDEMQRFRRVWSVEGGFSEFRSGEDAGGASASWTGGADWPEGPVATRYTQLGWRDLMKRDFRRPPWTVLAGAVRIFTLFALAGGYGQGLRAHWANGLFFLYPAVLLLAVIALAVLPAVLLPGVLPGSGLQVAGLVIAVTPIWMAALYFLTRLAEGRTYFWYLLHDWTSIGRLARNEDPQMRARIGTFADRIVEAAAECGPDEELVLTAHSSGTFVLVYALEQVLRRVPDFGASQGKVTVVTMGSAFGYVGGFGAEHGFGAAVAAVASARHLDWTDVYGPHDVLCCGRTAPVASYAPELSGRVPEPQRFSVRIPDRMDKERYRNLRLRFFKLHFCYFFASEKQNLFDYYRLTLGPLPASRQLRLWAKVR